MPDPITHIALRRDVVEKHYDRGTDAYLGAILSLYVHDSDSVFKMYPRLRPLYRTGKERMHYDAPLISLLSRRFPGLEPMRFSVLHASDDKLLHPNYIDPLSDRLVYGFDMLRNNGNNGKEAAHGLLEVVIGTMLLENDPTLGEDLTASIRNSKNYARGYAGMLSVLYNKSQKTFEHALLLTRFLYMHFDKNRNKLSRAMISYSIEEDGPYARRLKKILLNAFTYKLEKIPVRLVGDFTCSLMDLVEDFTSVSGMDDDYMNNLILQARELILKFDSEKTSKVSAASARRMARKDRVLPYMYSLCRS